MSEAKSTATKGYTPIPEESLNRFRSTVTNANDRTTADGKQIVVINLKDGRTVIIDKAVAIAQGFAMPKLMRGCAISGAFIKKGTMLISGQVCTQDDTLTVDIEIEGAEGMFEEINANIMEKLALKSAEQAVTDRANRRRIQRNPQPQPEPQADHKEDLTLAGAKK